MSSIEWTDDTWSSMVGCDRASDGCDHCYTDRKTITQQVRIAQAGSAECEGRWLRLFGREG